MAPFHPKIRTAALYDRKSSVTNRSGTKFEKPDTYPELKTHLGARINIDLIRDNWDEFPGLNLVVSAIVHWNTVYVARIVGSLKGKGRTIPGHLLKHVSPISWEHINLTGIYSWRTEPTDPTSFRPLREEKSVFGQAA